MPITDQYARLPLGVIAVDRDKRQRRELDSKGLIDSIAKRGVLNPIIVERETDASGCHRLMAGERRWLASQELGLPDIPVRFADELDPIEAQIYELEENIKRKNLEWQDTVRATVRIHDLYRNQNPGWSQDETAEALGITKGTVSIYLTIGDHIEHDEKISSQDTARAAYNVISGRRKREEAAIIDSLLQPRKKQNAEPAIGATLERTTVVEMPSHDFRSLQNPAKNILLEDFRHWAPRYSGPPFNLINCDFPYGISVFEGPQAGGERHHAYDDSRETHFTLLDALLDNFDRIASRSCHVVYWFSMQYYEPILSRIRDKVPELIVHPHPLIWIKSDNSGIASDPQHFPRHIYETALLMSRNRRNLVSLASDAYSAPTDRTWHVHTKPEPVLKYFFAMLIDRHTSFLDPTCGSGSSVRAAEALGSRWVLGMDIDETIVGQARAALRHARAKAGAAIAVS